MKKRIISIIMSIILPASMLCGCGASASSDTASSGSGKIYMSVSSLDDTFRKSLADAAAAEAKTLGVTLDIGDAKGSVETQVEQMQQAASGGYSSILCLPVNADTAQQLEVAAGDLPICFTNVLPDTSTLKPDKYIYVGSNEEDAGAYQAEYVLNQLGSKDEINVVLFMGEKNHSGTIGRTSAFQYTMKDAGKKVNYVFKDYASWSDTTAAADFKIFLQTGQPYDAIVCNNDTMALGVVQACKDENIDMTNLPICGVDATKDGLAAIDAGTMKFTVFQNAAGQGKALVDAAVKLGSGGSIKGMENATDDLTYVWVPFEKVDKSNSKDYE